MFTCFRKGPFEKKKKKEKKVCFYKEIFGWGGKIVKVLHLRMSVLMCGLM